jgi:hypothetical protein
LIDSRRGGPAVERKVADLGAICSNEYQSGELSALQPIAESFFRRHPELRDAKKNGLTEISRMRSEVRPSQILQRQYGSSRRLAATLSAPRFGSVDASKAPESLLYDYGPTLPDD